MARYFPDLVEEYKETLANLKACGGDLSMQRELKEAIIWMETGYDPAEYRAATRIDAFVMDHHLMQDLISYVDNDRVTPSRIADVLDNCIDDSDVKEIERMYHIKQEVNAAMRGLTENERAVFVMIKSELMTYGKVAKTLGISRSSVQSYLERAERKIAANIHSGSQQELDLFAS